MRRGRKREGKGREGKGREGKGREGKGREGKGREAEDAKELVRFEQHNSEPFHLHQQLELPVSSTHLLF